MNGWGEIVREHGPTAFTAAWHILGDADQAEAAAQEIFRRAWQIGLVRHVRCWATLFRRLAVRCALTRLRAHPALRRRPGPAGRLRAALARLAREEASAYALRYFEGLPPDRIAATLRLGEPSVRAALGRASARLGVLLGDAAERQLGPSGTA
ncbi:MAG: sigma factor-like helix-turn-helix DNA-binding protein [Gemmataceae bacterium]